MFTISDAELKKIKDVLVEEYKLNIEEVACVTIGSLATAMNKLGIRIVDRSADFSPYSALIVLGIFNIKIC